MHQQDVTLEVTMAPNNHGVSALLRDARERRGMSIEDVARQLRIRQPFLEAIEDGDYRQLPGSTYASGFVRAYAELMDLDVEEVVRQFKVEAAGGFAPRTELVFPSPVSESGRLPGGAFLFMGLILCVLAYGGWYWLSSSEVRLAELVPDVPARLASLLQRDSDPDKAMRDVVPPGEGGEAPATQAAAPAPVAAPVPAPTIAVAPAPVAPAAPAPQSQVAQPQAVQPQAAQPPAPVASAAPQPAPQPPVPPAALEPGAARVYGQENRNSRVTLKANEEAWVQVRDGAGVLLLARLLRKGESYVVPNRSDLTLMTGNAGALEIQLDGKLLPPLGASGVVRRDIPLDPEKLARPN